MDVEKDRRRKERLRDKNRFRKDDFDSFKTGKKKGSSHKSGRKRGYDVMDIEES